MCLQHDGVCPQKIVNGCSMRLLCSCNDPVLATCLRRGHSYVLKPHRLSDFQPVLSPEFNCIEQRLVSRIRSALSNGLMKINNHQISWEH